MCPKGTVFKKFLIACDTDILTIGSVKVEKGVSFFESFLTSVKDGQ